MPVTVLNSDDVWEERTRLRSFLTLIRDSGYSSAFASHMASLALMTDRAPLEAEAATKASLRLFPEKP